MKRRVGSLSLILILILTPIVLILTTLVSGARLHMETLDIERALSAQVKSGLAGFSKPLYEEFGLFGLSDSPASDVFSRMLPTSLDNIRVVQKADQSLLEPAILKSAILQYMQPRLPASLVKTIADQTGIHVGPDRAAMMAFPVQTSSLTAISSRYEDEFTGQVHETVKTMLDSRVQEVLGDDTKGMLEQYHRYVAECTTSLPDEQGLLEVPDIFNPSQISQFARSFSQVLTVPSHQLFQKLAIREYVLGMFWSAGQPSQAIRANRSDVLVTGDHLVHKNLSGIPLSQFDGREKGETERIITGAGTPKRAIAQVKTILVLYRASLFLFRQIGKADGLSRYRAAAGAITTAIAVVSSGTVLVDPEIIAYVLLACDALREGFSDYGRLMKGERLSFPGLKTGEALALDYPMHLRLLLLMTSEKTILKRVSEQLEKHHRGSLLTRITIHCQYRGHDHRAWGSVLTLQGVS